MSNKAKQAAEKSSFQILDEMSLKNMDIQLAPLSNIISADMKGGKGVIKIGVSAHLIMRLAKGEKFVGGLILANEGQFNDLRHSRTNP